MVRVTILQHPVVVCQRLLIACELSLRLLVVEHVRELLGRRGRWGRRRKFLVEEAIGWPVWCWRPSWWWRLEGRRRGRWKLLVLEGAEILLATVEAARAEGQRIWVEEFAHAGAFGGSELALGDCAVSTCLGLLVVGVSGRSCDWSAVGDAVPS